MFVVTAKLSKSKLLGIGVLLVAVVALMILLLAGGTGSSAGNAPIGNTNDDRVAYLATFGWSVNAEPTETQKVKIPEAPSDQVFARYNDLQRSQGFDLSEYAGKEVMRYVYEVLNYPDASEPVYATVLVYEGKIIGGDVTDTAPDGPVHGFAAPSGHSAADTNDASDTNFSDNAASDGNASSHGNGADTDTTDSADATAGTGSDGNADAAENTGDDSPSQATAAESSSESAQATAPSTSSED